MTPRLIASFLRSPLIASPLIASPLIASALVGVIASTASTAYGYELEGATLVPQLELPDDDGDFKPRDATTQIEYFNMAHCVCDVPFQIQYQLQDDPGTLATEEVEIWVGSQCDTSSTIDRDRTCQQLQSISDINDLRSPTDVQISVKSLAATNQDSCTAITQDRNVYAIIDEQNDGVGDGDHSFPLAIAVDTQMPPEPACISAEGGESAVLVSWDPPTSREDDIAFYQVLCARVDEQPLSSDVANPDARYLTARKACGASDDTAVTQACACGDDSENCDNSAAQALPSALQNLDEGLVCGSVVGGAVTSVRVDNLENGTEYHVVLVVVDQARNANPFYLGVVTPQPVQDAWEHYLNSGGTAKGGCSASSQSSLAGLGWVLLICAIGWTRRRRWTLWVGCLSILMVSSTVAAQPYWNDYNEPVDLLPSQPHWNIGIGLSPYTPNIDSEFAPSGDQEGPFARMFGDGRFWLTQLTLERYFLTHVGSTRIGQLGLAASVGFMTTGANAFVVGDNGEVTQNSNGQPIRSEGDRTKFRFLPTSLSAVYRFTALDDGFGIPIVPYAKLGLSYYLWWVTAPDGSIAQSTTGACAGSNSTACRARGGSLGWQTSLGLSVRFERIDPDAENSLRNELGIEHAGLFVEWLHANVDGFGADDKLSLGETTWVAGINFEF